MATVRSAAVAGQFYPAGAAQLQSDVDSMLASAGTDAPCPKALVAPHAGYVYSGSIAAEVYARLRNSEQPITRVVLLGPSHRVGFRGIATSSADFFTTPLGQIPLDKAAQQQILQLPGVHERDAAHNQEHSLEVQLPFLQRSLQGFSLVPLVVGDADTEQVAAVIDGLWGGPETLLVISSDLSHFLDYQAAQSKDAVTRRRIENREATLSGDEACGCRPLNGLLTVLQRRQLGIKTVDVRNSGDTAGSRDRVVGYGAWVVESPVHDDANPETDTGKQSLSLAQRQQLLHLARNAITGGLNGAELNIPLAHYHPDLQAQRASFVTLNINSRLRGCIGSLLATRPLLLDVAHNATSAAFKDPRFKPLGAHELSALELHISVLSEPQPVAAGSRQALLDYLEPGIHGLILQQGRHRSTYLPSVWKMLPEPEQFLSELRAKAGLPKSGWSDAIQVSVYTTEEFG
ncbi:MAG: AmmeMemoRadiSam system protein B [Halieaceae bacterium]